MIFCGFRSVAVNTVYKQQFFLHLYQYICSVMAAVMCIYVCTENEMMQIMNISWTSTMFKLLFVAALPSPRASLDLQHPEISNSWK